MLRYLCCLLAVAALGFASRLTAADRPNVLIVMTDDQGLGDFSFTGNPVLKTPNLDAFAKESVRLTDFHVCPMCTPDPRPAADRPGALRNGATSVTAGRTFLRPGIPTLPELFAKAGLQDRHLRQVAPRRQLPAPADRQGVPGERLPPRLGAAALDARSSTGR